MFMVYTEQTRAYTICRNLRLLSWCHNPELWQQQWAKPSRLFRTVEDSRSQATLLQKQWLILRMHFFPLVRCGLLCRSSGSTFGLSLAVPSFWRTVRWFLQHRSRSVSGASGFLPCLLVVFDRSGTDLLVRLIFGLRYLTSFKACEGFCAVRLVKNIWGQGILGSFRSLEKKAAVCQEVMGFFKMDLYQSLL